MNVMTGDQIRIIANATILDDGMAGMMGALESLDLPSLTGSPKQVEWAKLIRAHGIHVAVREMLLSAPKGQKNAYANTAARMVAEHSTDAKWWIENREKMDVILDYLKALAAK